MNFLTEKSSKVLIWLGLLIVIIGLALFLYNESIDLGVKIKSDKVGQLGDFVGGIAGAVWALAGVILFYVALEKQKEALSVQIKEFQLQRKELEETRKVFTAQGQTQAIAQYETSFYNLIDLLLKIVGEFKYSTTSTRLVKEAYMTNVGPQPEKNPAEYQYIPVEITGRDFISQIYKDFDKDFTSILGKVDMAPYFEIPKEYFDKYEVYLRPYFNIITQLLVKIDNCPLENRDHYKEVFAAMLTNDEVNLIRFYGGQSYIDNRLCDLFKKYYD